MSWVAAALALCTTATIAGCGQSTPGATHASGRQLFAQHCGSCHTLAAAGTTGAIGPNLGRLFAGKPAASIEPIVRHQIASGGGGMPAGIVSDGAAKAISAYVAAAAR